jgi:hypothetical protein
MSSKFKSNVIDVFDENDDDESDSFKDLFNVDEDMPLFKRGFY